MIGIADTVSSSPKVLADGEGSAIVGSGMLKCESADWFRSSFSWKEYGFAKFDSSKVTCVSSMVCLRLLNALKT